MGHRRREQAGGHDERTQKIQGMSHYGCPEEDGFLYPTSQGVVHIYLAKGKNELPEFVFPGPSVLLKDGSRTEGKFAELNNDRNSVFLKAWRFDCNHCRPLGGLGHLSPKEYVDRHNEIRAANSMIFQI